MFYCSSARSDSLWFLARNCLSHSCIAANDNFLFRLSTFAFLYAHREREREERRDRRFFMRNRRNRETKCHREEIGFYSIAVNVLISCKTHKKSKLSLSSFALEMKRKANSYGTHTIDLPFSFHLRFSVFSFANSRADYLLRRVLIGWKNQQHGSFSLSPSKLKQFFSIEVLGACECVWRSICSSHMQSARSLVCLIVSKLENYRSLIESSTFTTL